MPPNNFVPDVPTDWASRAATGTPYVLGVVGGAAAWVPLVVFPIVTDNAAQVVTASNGYAVFIQPA